MSRSDVENGGHRHSLADLVRTGETDRLKRFVRRGPSPDDELFAFGRKR